MLVSTWNFWFVMWSMSFILHWHWMNERTSDWRYKWFDIPRRNSIRSWNGCWLIPLNLERRERYGEILNQSKWLVHSMSTTTNYINLQRSPLRIFPLRGTIFNSDYGTCKSGKLQRNNERNIHWATLYVEKHLVRASIKLIFYHLLSGTSSPSKCILNLMPTEYRWLTASRYLFKPTINWLVLTIFHTQYWERRQHLACSPKRKTNFNIA